MKLNELFSPIGAPSDNDDINWGDDLKAYIDNDNEVLSNVLFPAVKKHQEHPGHPDAYKIYIKPLQQCKDMYCNKFQVDDAGDKFPKDMIITLAKQIANEQEKFIQRGDYEN